MSPTFDLKFFLSTDDFSELAFKTFVRIDEDLTRRPFEVSSNGLLQIGQISNVAQKIRINKIFKLSLNQKDHIAI